MHEFSLVEGEIVTHRFGLDDIMQAYDTFADAAKTSALKVVLNGRGTN